MKIEVTKIPVAYLSKRENGTYSLIVNGTSVNQYTDKESCLKLCERYKITGVLAVWNCESGVFQEDINL
jgi:hypothetical protein